MKKINEVLINADDVVVLSRDKILMSYGTLREFGRFYDIKETTLRNSFKKGATWGTLNKSGKLNKVYIDWDRTKFQIVDQEIKDAYVKVAEHEGGVYGAS